MKKDNKNATRIDQDNYSNEIGHIDDPNYNNENARNHESDIFE